VEDEAEGPDVHFFEAEFEQVLGQDDVFFHFGGIVVETCLELPQLLLDFVSHQQRLPQHDFFVVHVEVFDMNGAVRTDCLHLS